MVALRERGRATIAKYSNLTGSQTTTATSRTQITFFSRTRRTTYASLY
jgi:hypothetical protein